MLDKLKPEPNLVSTHYESFKAGDISVYPGADWAQYDPRYFTYLQSLIQPESLEIDTVFVVFGQFGPEAIKGAGKLIAIKEIDESFQVRCQCLNASQEDIALMICREFLSAQTSNRIDLAQVFKALLVNNSWSHQKLGDALGLSVHTITNTLRLGKLHPRVQTLVRIGKLNVAKAKHLISEPASRQVTLAQNCVVKDWTERRLVKEIKGGFERAAIQERGKASKPQSPYLSSAIHAIEEAIAHPIDLNEGPDGGLTLTVHFHSLEALAGVADQLERKIGGSSGFAGSVSIGAMTRDKFDALFELLVDDF